MDVQLLKKVEAILSGRASVKEAQKHLAKIGEDDLKDANLKEKLTPLLETYKERNNYKSEPVPLPSEEEMDDIWQNIIASPDKPAPAYSPEYESLQFKLSNILSVFFSIIFKKYSLAVPVILTIMIIIPLVYKIQNQPVEYVGIKGEETKLQASLKFAIADSAGNLQRPDRPLTEGDTLAFRIETNTNGFYSIYIIHNDHIDKVISDIFFNKGANDLNVGYSLSGNHGTNTLVMLFTDNPVPIAELEKQKLILESARNNVSSMTIDKNLITMNYQKIEVE